jgi:acyl-CoA synthetase (AMP-forming)/AMP-acid ligase II
MLFPLLVGSTVVIDHGLESKEFVEFLRESRVTRLLGIPPFFLKLLIVCKNEKQPVPSFKSITVTQGNLSAELRKAFSLFKISVLQCYGMTENAWTISMQSLEVEPTADAEGSELELALGGRPLPGLKYKVLDDTGEEIEGTRERMGQLAVSGPTVMQGYRGLEKETKSAIRGTWLYTGDIVKLEGTGEDLRIHFIGRKDDLLIIDGEAVPLRRVDKALKGIVGVQDAASFVVNNSRGERLLVAAVVKIQNSALSEKQIKEQAGSKLPGHFVPQYIAFTDHIPRDAAGNVAYHRLRGQFSEIAG